MTNRGILAGFPTPQFGEIEMFGGLSGNTDLNSRNYTLFAAGGHNLTGTNITNDIAQFDAYQSNGAFSNCSMLIDPAIGDYDDFALQGDFIIEFDYKTDSINSSTTYIVSREQASVSALWGFTRLLGSLTFFCDALNMNGANEGLTAPGIQANADWINIKIVRFSGVCGLYIDSVLMDSKTCEESDLHVGSVVPLAINGRYQPSSGLPNVWNGNNQYRNFAFLRDVTLAGSGDELWQYVELLLRFQGSNGSTTFTDESPKSRSVANSGSAQISTMQSKFGGASGLFDGTGDYLAITHDAVFDTMIDSSFALECWVYVETSHKSIAYIAAKRDATPAGWAFALIDTGKPAFFGWNTSTAVYVVIQDTSAILTDEWVHLAVSFDGTDYRLFVDGAIVDSTASVTGSYQSTTNAIRIGSNPTNSAHDFDGFIDNLRITSGSARYTAAFTPQNVAVGFPSTIS